MHSGDKPSTDGFCGLFGARLKIFFWLPKKALAGEAVCKIRNAVYLKALRPKGQKVNSGLKPIRGKQESRSQKRLPLSCIFLAGSFARRTDKIFEKISKQSKKFVFITILCCTVYNRRFKRRTFRFSKYPGWRKRTKRGRRFLVAPVQFAR